MSEHPLIEGFGFDADFHDLMHPIWDCDRRLHHARLWWTYIGLERVLDVTVGPLRRVLCCPRGDHEWVEVYGAESEGYGDGDGPDWEECRWCRVSTRK